MRKQVALFGKTNAGKSSLFNALLGQQRAIVSEIPGTTTDAVSKAMELLPFGPITLIDTAGLSDGSDLGILREKRTQRWLDTADFALYVIDWADYDEAAFEAMKAAFEERELPFIVVWMKWDLYPSQTPPQEGFTVSVQDENAISALRSALAERLREQTQTEESLINGLLPSGSVAVMVAPLDSAAPVGRLILPQVQFLRDCLDHDIRCHVVNEKGLSSAIAELPHIDLVVTDSQIFGAVNAIVPSSCPLTSFSILLARQKGNFQRLYEGAKAIGTLKEGDRVLMGEACTHNRTHEDIGQVKLPRLLEKSVGGKLTFDFYAGKDFPDDLSAYQLIVHCGGCMLTPRVFLARQNLAHKQGVPMTNYGMTLAYGSKILERCVEILM